MDGSVDRDSHAARLTALLDAHPGAAPFELFADVDDEFWLWAHTEGRDTTPTLEAMLPGLPAPTVQRRWTGKCGSETLEEGFDIYRRVRDLYVLDFGSVRNAGRVLDFGCGFGRVIRYFLKDMPPGELIGTDCNQELVDFAAASNPWCRFQRNGAEPPLLFDDGEIGLLYAYSVFSHFSEPMHAAWLDEFTRLVRPRGALIITIRPRGFIEHCRRLRSGEVQGVSPINRRMFPDDEAALAAYDRGEFCFSPYAEHSPDAWWGEACIPPAYVEERWSDRFDVLEIVRARDLKQHVVVLRAR